MFDKLNLKKTLILVVVILGIIIVFFAIIFVSKPVLIKNYDLDFKILDASSIYVNVTSYEMKSPNATFLSETSYTGADLSSGFRIDKENNFVKQTASTDLSNNIGYQTAIIINKTISESPYHSVRFSSEFSLDFNLPFYEFDKSQLYPHNINFQNILANNNLDFIFANRIIVCSDFTTGSHKVQYNYYDLSSNSPVFDTGCTIAFNDSRSFTNYCLYPHKCTELNTIDYDKGTTTVSLSDENGKAFFTTSFDMPKSVFNYSNGVYLKYIIGNQNFCDADSCKDFTAYVYSVSISAN